MAIAVSRHAPARAAALLQPMAPIENLLTPLGHGVALNPDGSQGGFVICRVPPGPSLAANRRPWPESVLIEQVLRPAAQVLESLRARGLTHRAIRPDNLFLSLPGRPVTLGAAWAAPPAMHQPALFEPPYSALCHPAARGDGTIADDIYALGCVLIVLALGRWPMPGLDDAAVLRRKLELGSFAAMAGDERLPPIIADLTRGMLAEDPDHRPPPSLLLDPMTARGRRVAARPPRRAQRPLPIGESLVWDARTLACAIGTNTDQAPAALRDGEVTQWLRRGLGDATLATRIDDLVRHRAAEAPQDGRRADAMMLMRAVALIDPLAPLCWRGTALWPDGLGAGLAAGQGGDPALLAHLEEVVTAEAAGIWATLREDRCDGAVLRMEARQQRGLLRTRGVGGGVPRLVYALNPLLPCASPLMGARWVARLSDLAPALEAAVGTAPDLIDAHVAAFIAARSERRLEQEISDLAGAGDGAAQAMARLRLLSQVQARYHPMPLPALADWIASQAGPLVARWANRTRRTWVADRLKALAAEGALAPMLAIVEDPAAQSADRDGAQRAAAELSRIDAELAGIRNGAEARKQQAVRLGQEVAAGLGLSALAAMLILAVLT